MNWIPKEKNQSTRPTERQKMEEYFRNHRRKFQGAIGFSEDAPDTSSQFRLRSLSNSGQRSSLSSESGTASSSGNKQRHRSTTQHSRGSSSEKSQHAEYSQHTLNPDLSELNMRKLAQTVQGKRNQPVSTDLVHLEMIKRMFSYQPASQTVEPETREDPVDQPEEPSMFGRENQVFLYSPRSPRPEQQHHGYQRSISNWDDKNLTKKKNPRTYAMGEIPGPRHVSQSLDLGHDLFPMGEDKSQLSSSPPSFFWNIADFGRSYGTDNPALTYSRKE